jgi:phosphatidylserine/phosphatidylglycerophosphate/cardiolipin synthase-like enzyme
MARKAKAKAATRSSGAANSVQARAYTSPTLVLLAMDWPAGARFSDFLGFAILRSPGFTPKEKDGFLFNKIGFDKPGPNSQPLPSSLAPFQKFLWWDGGIDDKDRGKTFKYTITPVRGTGPKDLALQHDNEVTITVKLPLVEEDGISTWFNRAVVSSQAFSRKFPDPAKDISGVMDWLANGLENSFGAILKPAKQIDGAIYHLTDKRWVMPAFKGFKGPLSLVYEDRTNDQTDLPAIKLLKSKNFKGHPRSKTNIMHDKFLVDVDGGRVLMGSANFTPEGLTSQANLLHIFNSPQLAKLYSKRQQLMIPDPKVAATAVGAAWSPKIKVGKVSVRVFFSPEPSDKRVSIDTVIAAVKNAKKSVIFCMFDPTDPTLIKSLLATGDRKKLLYGLLNSISDPSKKKKKKSDPAADQSDSGEAPKKPTAATQIKVTLFNRSRKDKQVLAYSYFRPGNTPADFLPELNSVDLSSQSTLKPAKPAKGKKPHAPPAVHIHHKFIVIDAETDSPTIYTGSANLSNNSTHRNDENLLEITGSPALAQIYLAEFMRLYEHYRARALWNIRHASKKGGAKKTSKSSKADSDRFLLKRRRDDWVNDAYKRGTLAFIARTQLAD